MTSPLGAPNEPGCGAAGLPCENSIPENSVFSCARSFGRTKVSGDFYSIGYFFFSVMRLLRRVIPNGRYAALLRVWPLCSLASFSGTSEANN